MTRIPSCQIINLFVTGTRAPHPNFEWLESSESRQYSNPGASTASLGPSHAGTSNTTLLVA
eukprot:1577241-Rhodomonas_salina.5